MEEMRIRYGGGRKERREMEGKGRGRGGGEEEEGRGRQPLSGPYSSAAMTFPDGSSPVSFTEQLQPFRQEVSAEASRRGFIPGRVEKPPAMRARGSRTIPTASAGFIRPSAAALPVTPLLLAQKQPLVGAS